MITKHALLTFAYLFLCFFALFGIFWKQGADLLKVRLCYWLPWQGIALAVFWEIIDCVRMGPPGFPASRWLLLAALAAACISSAIRSQLADHGLKKGTAP